MENSVCPSVCLTKLLNGFNLNLLFGVSTKNFRTNLYLIRIGIILGLHEAQIQFYPFI
jgi:hypothetical protein